MCRFGFHPWLDHLAPVQSLSLTQRHVNVTPTNCRTFGPELLIVSLYPALQAGLGKRLGLWPVRNLHRDLYRNAVLERRIRTQHLTERPGTPHVTGYFDMALDALDRDNSATHRQPLRATPGNPQGTIVAAVVTRRQPLRATPGNLQGQRPGSFPSPA